MTRFETYAKQTRKEIRRVNHKKEELSRKKVSQGKAAEHARCHRKDGVDNAEQSGENRQELDESKFPATLLEHSGRNCVYRLFSLFPQSDATHEVPCRNRRHRFLAGILHHLPRLQSRITIQSCELTSHRLSPPREAESQRSLQDQGQRRGLPSARDGRGEGNLRVCLFDC